MMRICPICISQNSIISLVNFLKVKFYNIDPNREEFGACDKNHYVWFKYKEKKDLSLLYCFIIPDHGVYKITSNNYNNKYKAKFDTCLINIDISISLMKALHSKGVRINVQ